MAKVGLISRYAPLAAAILSLLVFWHLLALALDSPALPGPVVSIEAFIRAMQQGLIYHFGVSAYRVLVSIVISFIVAVPVGLVLGREERLDRFFAPLIYLIYPIPKIVFLPVVMVILGLGHLSKIFLISLVVFFQILMTTRDAARNVNRATVDSLVSLGAGRRHIYFHVIWPAALPQVLTALRIASGTAIAVLFFSETWASQEGLGYYLVDSWSRYAYNDMFAGIIAMGLLGFLLYSLLDFLEKKLCPWEYV